MHIDRVTRFGLPLLLSMVLIGSWFAITSTRTEKWVSITGEDDSLMKRYQEAMKSGKGILKDGEKAVFYIQEEGAEGDQRKDLGKTLKQLTEKGDPGETQPTSLPMDKTSSMTTTTATTTASATTTTPTTAATAKSTTMQISSSSPIRIAGSKVPSRGTSLLEVPKELKQYLPPTLRHNTCRINYHDRLIPYCGYCQDFDMSRVTIYVDAFENLNSADREKIKRYMEDGAKCSLPAGTRCSFTKDDKMSDAVLKVVQGLNASAPPRFCFPQTIILFSLADLPRQADLGLSMYSEVHVNFNMHSEMEYVEMCRHMPHLLEAQLGPRPSPGERSGIAMFISNCNKKYNDRLIYLIKLMKHVRIDSYGRCLYNMRDKTGVFRPPSKKPDNWEEEFIRIASRYKIVVAFEHVLEPHVISEKVFLILRAGAIPLYRGAPDIDLQIPGNNSVINVGDFSTIESLGKYLNRVLSEPSLYLKHAQWNWDVLDSLNNKHCGVKLKSEESAPDMVSCQMCKEAYNLKLSSYRGGSRACNCFNQPPPLF